MLEKLVQNYRILMWNCPMPGTPKLCGRLTDCQYKGENHRFHYFYCNLYSTRFGRFLEIFTKYSSK